MIEDTETGVKSKASAKFIERITNLLHECEGLRKS
jgi:hypothetical protein